MNEPDRKVLNFRHNTYLFEVWAERADRQVNISHIMVFRNESQGRQTHYDDLQPDEQDRVVREVRLAFR